MKPFEGFKSEAAQGGAYPMLPAGTYVAGIKNVKINGTDPDQQLVLRLDIIEGEWAGYYTKRYEHDGRNTMSRFPVKYRGDLRIQIPNQANARRAHPEWDVRTFNGTIYAIEQSNPGYRWDWNEGSLKGKTVGINVREGTYNGNPFTQIARLEVADDVRKGLVRTMKPKAPSGSEQPAADQPAGFTPAEEDVPF